MEQRRIKTKGIQKDVCTGIYKTAEGLELSDQQVREICKYFSVPETLVNVDNKFGTTTALDVLNKTKFTEGMEVIMEGDKIISVLDPKSKFVTDLNFDTLISKVCDMGLDISNTKVNGAQKRVTFDLKETATDSFMDDVFKRQIHIDRLSEGGIRINSAFLRLACTNGMLVPDSTMMKLIRSGKVNDDQLSHWLGDMGALDVETWFKKKLFIDGAPVDASVADYMGMRGTLRDLTDDEVADFYFPVYNIADFYGRQDIDITKTPRDILKNLRSGLSYYDCYNILTHGVKQAEELTLQNEIDIARWVKPTTLRYNHTMLGRNIQGMPHFDHHMIQILKGDKRE